MLAVDCHRDSMSNLGPLQKAELNSLRMLEMGEKDISCGRLAVSVPSPIGAVVSGVIAANLVGANHGVYRRGEFIPSNRWVMMNAVSSGLYDDKS